MKSGDMEGILQEFFNSSIPNPMKQNNIILEKSYAFALKIVNLYIQLKNENEYILSKQLLRSGTSIGASSEEGAAAQSKKEFISKFSLALKESKEAHYWLRLLRDSKLIDEHFAKQLLLDCDELIILISSILKTQIKHQ